MVKKRAYAIILILILFSIDSIAGESILTQKWEYDIGGGLGEGVGLKEFAVVDLDGDGKKEVVLISFGSAGTPSTALKNSVHVFDKDGNVLWRYRIKDFLRAGFIGDINRDNKIELVLTSGQKQDKISRGRVYLIAHDGKSIGDYGSTAIMDVIDIADINHDGLYEIAAGSESKVHLFYTSGETLWTYPRTGSGALEKAVEAIKLADITGDGIMEVLCGEKNLFILDVNGYKSGSFELDAGVPEYLRGVRWIELANLTGARVPEILVATKTNRVYALIIKQVITTGPNRFSLRIEELWSYRVEGNINDILRANMDDDGYDEIVAALSDNKLHVYDSSGKPLWDYQLDSEPKSVYVADIDNDGLEDVLVGTTGGGIYALEKNGDFKWKANIDGRIIKTTAGDLDGNGLNEIILVSEKPVVYVLEMNESYTKRREAKGYYNLAESYYIRSEYNKSREYLLMARKLYMELGDNEVLGEIQALLNEIDTKVIEERRKLADVYYDKAQDYFISREYDKAKAFAERAKEVYAEFGDTENILKCELLELRISQELGIVKETTTMTVPEGNHTLPPPPPGPNIQNILLLLIVVAILIGGFLYLRKRRESKEPGELGWGRELDRLNKELEEL